MPREQTEHYPWEELDWSAEESPVEHFWTSDLRSSPAELWPVLSDTSLVNARLGLPEMTFEERGGRLHGSSGKFLTLQEWVEVPWEWEAEKSLTAERRYSKGPACVVRVRYLLNDRLGGTRLTIYFGWTPRRWWSRPVLRWINQWLEKRYSALLLELDEEVVRAEGRVLQPSGGERSAAVSEFAIVNGMGQLLEAGFDSSETARLATHIREASDQVLFRIRPKVLAFEWGTELDEVLRLLLHATKAGLLSITWDVICPHCQGVRKEAKSLGDLREYGHCEVCDIDFDATTQESVEVTFRVLPEIREVREVFYCSAEPAKKPHIILQQNLAPEAIYKADLKLAEGRYRLRTAVGEGASRSLEAVPGGGLAELGWDLAHGNSEALELVDQYVRITLNNSTPSEASVVLEKLAHDSKALRPSELFGFQEFRDLFSEESLTTGLRLEVGYQNLLFSDIVGSSHLYTKLGDTSAFNAVHEHFVALQEIVRSHQGAVVKTIGDAMMASFRSPLQALEASIAIQRAFPPGGQEIALRVSVHRGQCLAVKLDSNIDYFGNAVNYAAKVQSMAGAGEIVYSAAFFELPVIAEHAERCGLDFRTLPSKQQFGEGYGPVVLARLGASL